MALRTMQTRGENGEMRGVGRQPAGKSFFQKPEIRPRAALGSLTSNAVVDRLHAGKAMKGKKPVTLRQPKVVLTKEPLPLVTTQPAPSVARKSVEHEDMEVGHITEAISEHLHIEDIDADDSENPQLCAAYVKEIYQYMTDLERKYHVNPDYLQQQPNIDARMRTILIDWLIQVHLRFTLLQETLYLTISIIDRFLELKTVEKSKLQLVGVTAMLIASKYEEMYAPEVRDFVYITDNTYSSLEIRNMEREMLRVLEYNLGSPLCLHFLRRFSRAGEATPEMHTMAKFLMELCLPYHSTLKFLPSQQAAAALCFAMKLYGKGKWSPTMVHYSRYTEAEILPCMSKMAQRVTNIGSAKQKAVRDKYSASRFMRVAKEDMLQGQIVHDLVSSAE